MYKKSGTSLSTLNSGFSFTALATFPLLGSLPKYVQLTLKNKNQCPQCQNCGTSIVSKYKRIFQKGDDKVDT